jgi:hypothetical protein
MYNVTLRRVLANVVAVEKQRVLRILMCVFVVLVIQDALRMCPIIFSSVACRAVQYFSTFFFTNDTILERKKLT